MRKVCSETFTKESFKASMAKCFISVGLAPDAMGKFVEYTNHRRGTLAIKKEPEDKATVGEVAAELEMVQRGGVDADGEGDDGAGGGGDESDESDDDDE